MLEVESETKFTIESLYESPLVEYNDLYKNEARMKKFSDDTACVPSTDVTMTSVTCSADMSV